MFEESNTLGEYRWECPYRECKYSILSYTQSSFEQRKAEHLDKHLKKLREEREEREKKLTELLEPLGISFSKNPDKLHVSWYDVAFLTTRHIAIDEDIDWDGYSEVRPNVTTT